MPPASCSCRLPPVMDYPMAKTLNLAILLSGSGRTLQNFIDLAADGKLPVKITVVVASKPRVGGLERAQKAGIPAFEIDRKGFPNAVDWSAAVNRVLGRHPVDAIAMAGLIHLYIIPPEYAGRVLNIHPALLPQFGGKGMYTDRVHEAVLASGTKISGCTVHIADNEYDRGPILLQKTVPVLDDDTPHALADRVFAAECEAYPEVLRRIAAGKIVWPYRAASDE